MNVCKTIYDTKWNVDFALHHPDKDPLCLIIECKWQQVGGSVDEKYPYLVHNIKEQSLYNAIVLLDGDSYKSETKECLKSK